MAVINLREKRLRTVFNDFGAVIYFLRLLIWIVSRYTVEGYYDKLRTLHNQIQQSGPFVTYASRLLTAGSRRARNGARTRSTVSPGRCHRRPASGPRSVPAPTKRALPCVPMRRRTLGRIDEH